MKNYNLLLLTCTIKPSFIKNNDDYNTRLQHYLEATKFYINISNIDGIVLIDSNAFNFDESPYFSELKNLASKLGKDIELISFVQDFDEMQKYNYGYGEFQILNHFQENSKLLLKSKSFYKITGRYIINNIEEIIKSSENMDRLFYKFGLIDFFTVSTAFFKIDKECLSYILKQYKNIYENIGDSVESKDYLKTLLAEHVFFEILYGRYKFSTINIYPYTNVRSKNKYKLHEILLNIGYLDFNNIFIRFITYIVNSFGINFKLRYLKMITIVAGKIWS